jgi:hypothetical protein
MSAGVDLQKVVSSNLPAIVRLTALQAIHSDSMYSRPGDWLRTISDYDLYQLIDMSDQLTNDMGDKVTESFVALTMLLMQAEGVPFDECDLRPHVGALIHFLVMEGLARKGLIDVTYQNISFGDDAGPLEIARVREDPVPPVDPPVES